MYSKEQTFERRGGAPEPDATGSGDASAELEALVRELRSDLRSVYGSLKRIAFVEWQRMRLRAVDMFFRAAFILGLLGLVAIAGIAAGIYLMMGVRGALVAWTGVPWIGDLSTGLIVILGTLFGCLAVRRRVHNRILRRTKRRLAAESAPVKPNGPVKPEAVTPDRGVAA
jgi:hypothetical protein